MLNVQNYFEIKILLLFISKQFYLFFYFVSYFCTFLKTFGKSKHQLQHIKRILFSLNNLEMF